MGSLLVLLGIKHPARKNAGFFFGLNECKILHKFAQFLKRRFCCAAPALAGPGRSAQSAQKEACLARRRGGGASARFGGREGVGIPRQKPPAGRALSRCIRRERRQKPARMALAASGWGYSIEVFAGWPTWPGMAVLQVGTALPGIAVRYLQITSGFPAGRKG